MTQKSSSLSEKMLPWSEPLCFMDFLVGLNTSFRFLPPPPPSLLPPLFSLVRFWRGRWWLIKSRRILSSSSSSSESELNSITTDLSPDMWISILDLDCELFTLFGGLFDRLWVVAVVWVWPVVVGVVCAGAMMSSMASSMRCPMFPFSLLRGAPSSIPEGYKVQSTKYSTCTRKTQNTCIMVGKYTVSYIHDIICITQ